MIGQSGPSLLNHPTAPVEQAPEEAAKGAAKTGDAGAFAKVMLVAEAPGPEAELGEALTAGSREKRAPGAESAIEAVANRAPKIGEDAPPLKATMNKAMMAEDAPEAPPVVVSQSDVSASTAERLTDLEVDGAAKTRAGGDLAVTNGGDGISGSAVSEQEGDGATFSSADIGSGEAARASTVSEGNEKDQLTSAGRNADQASLTPAQGAQAFSKDSRRGIDGDAASDAADQPVATIRSEPSRAAASEAEPTSPLDTPGPRAETAEGSEPEKSDAAPDATSFARTEEVAPVLAGAAAASTGVANQSATSNDSGRGAPGEADPVAERRGAPIQTHSAHPVSAPPADAAPDALQGAHQAPSSGAAEVEAAASDSRRNIADPRPFEGPNRVGEQGASVEHAARRGAPAPDQAPAPTQNNAARPVSGQEAASPLAGSAPMASDDALRIAGSAPTASDDALRVAGSTPTTSDDALRVAATAKAAVDNDAAQVIQRPSVATAPSAALSALAQSLSDVPQIGQIALSGAAPAGLSIADAPGASHAQPGPDPKAVSHQITQAIVRLDGARTEVMLDPVELGRVSLTFVTKDEGVTVIVTADRPETADLLRRNGEQLQRDLTNVGYEGVELDFDGAHDDRRGQFAEDKRDRVRGGADETTTLQAVRLESGLDIRI